jgi:peptidoglycan-associated lipoprotein
MKKVCIIPALLICGLFLSNCSTTRTALPAPDQRQLTDQKKAAENRGTMSRENAPSTVITDEKIKESVIASDGARAEEKMVLELRDVLFDYDSYRIRQDAKTALDSTAGWLKNNKNISVVIEGYCDERGTNEYNLALGEKRAKTVKDYLASSGIKPTRMEIFTYGEEKPVCTMQNEVCYQKNRRAHFVVTN